MDRTYRVAILGCRSRGAAAARAYHAHPRCEVRGLCDLLPERVEQLGDELGIAARYGDLDRMIADAAPDIVAIPTATDLHYGLAMRVLEHGVNIDLEKPMVTTLDEADALLAKAAGQGVRVAVHHQGRVGAAMRAIGRAVAEGAIGTPLCVEACGKGYYGGYGLLNIGTHLLNSMLKLTGRCASVAAIALTKGRPVTPADVLPAPGGMGLLAGEHITAGLAFAGGMTGVLLHHRFQPVNSIAYGLVVRGTEGRLLWRGRCAWRLPQPHYVPDGEHDRWEPLALEHPPHYDPTGSAAADDYDFADEYVRALDEDRDHECSGAEARHVIEMMMGIFESAAYGRRVELPQERRDHPLRRWRSEHRLGDPEPMARDYAAWLQAADA